ncbi:hypothetical protein YPPY98_4039, partial [Yersinia pestis PY-98]
MIRVDESSQHTCGSKEGGFRTHHTPVCSRN